MMRGGEVPGEQSGHGRETKPAKEKHQAIAHAAIAAGHRRGGDVQQTKQKEG